jgi:ATP-dependent Lon protease
VLRLPLLDGFTEFTHAAGPLTVPARAPVLMLADTVVFPFAPARISVLGQRHHRLLAAIGREAYPAVFAVARTRQREEAPNGAADVFDVGVVARIRAVRDDGEGAFAVLLEGGPRARLLRCPVEEPDLVAELEPMLDERVDAAAGEAQGVERLRDAARGVLTAEFQDATWALDYVSARNDAATLAGIAVGGLDLSVKEAQRLLEAAPAERVRRVARLLEARR